MRKTIAVLVMSLTASGAGVMFASAASTHVGAAECIVLTNPTANFVVQTACNTVDPGGK